jgi:hypothetical protein
MSGHIPTELFGYAALPPLWLASHLPHKEGDRPDVTAHFSVKSCVCQYLVAVM